ncbi:MAG: PAS domain-containing protein [Sulfitobacter sp.]
MTSEKLSLVYQSMIYAAAGEQPFSDIMLRLAELNNAPGAVLFELNRKTGEITNFASPQLEFGEDGYNERLNAINPRMRYSMRHTAGHVTYEGRFTNEATVARHEFYDWLTRSKGLKYFLGVRLADIRDTSVFHSVEFANGADHPERELISQFSNTSKRLANAWRLSKHVTSSGPQWEQQSRTPDHLPWAIFAIMQDGKVSQMNAQAERILAKSNVVTLGPETLEAVHKPDHAKMHGMIRNAFSGSSSTMLLRDAVTHNYFVAQTIPVEQNGISMPGAVSALLYLWNPVELRHGDLNVIMQLWGLSRAEARIASRLAQGETLAEISDALQISRNHLQSFFEKTATSRQTELAILLFGVLELKQG